MDRFPGTSFLKVFTDFLDLYNVTVGIFNAGYVSGTLDSNYLNLVDRNSANLITLSMFTKSHFSSSHLNTYFYLRSSALLLKVSTMFLTHSISTSFIETKSSKTVRPPPQNQKQLKLSTLLISAKNTIQCHKLTVFYFTQLTSRFHFNIIQTFCNFAKTPIPKYTYCLYNR